MKRVAIWLLALSVLLGTSAPYPAHAQDEAISAKEQVRADIKAPAVPGQFLVQFKPGVAAADRAAVAAKVGAKVVDRVAALDVEVLEIPALKAEGDLQAVESVIQALKKDPNVVYVEPNYILTAYWVPNDPALSQQWAWDVIDAYEAWDITRGDSDTIIAVVDTGVQRNHPDLNGKIVAGYDFVDRDTSPDDGNGHGTHVAGTAAAETDNDTGGAGMCPECSIMPVRVLNNSGTGTLANVANGIIWAADNGAKVINLSLGGATGSTTLQNAIQYAWDNGVFLACAAGNEGTSWPSYPAYYPRCFAVAATTASDTKASFSNYGNWVQVAAPGVNIYSTWIGSGYNTISGTSMATPHVAGLAGLLSSMGLTNEQIWDRIMETADKIPGTGTYWIGGRINAFKAVSGEPDPGDPGDPGGNALQNGGFENGTAPWVQTSSGGYQLISNYRPRTGNYSAWLGGYNNGTDAISQTVTIPQNGKLTFWWYMTSDEGSSTAYDYLRVRLYNQNGSLLTTLVTRSNRDARNQWVQETVNLSSYAGQTVRLEFSVTTDWLLPTSFFIDDVELK